MSTTPGELARRGFLDATASAALVERLPWPQDGGWLDLFDTVADPDLALASLVRLFDEHPEWADRLTPDEPLTHRLVLVLGGSQALGQHLLQQPGDLEVLAETPRRHPAADIAGAVLGACTADGLSQTQAIDALKLANRRELVRISARDLGHPEPEQVLPDIAAELADLADAVLQAALELARREVVGHEATRLAVIALGKTGAGELNYISDVDVLFVAEPGTDADGAEVSADESMRVATRLAAALTRICSSHTAAGSIWQVDAALRPEGKAGALVRTLSSMRAYYEKWASNWEFQAMLKARVVAGDAEVGQGFLDIVQPLVWRAAEREHFLVETQAMRQRVIDTIPAKEADREIKLSSGGLRDTEFTVQLLQLVHGRADDRLRARDTLGALKALVDHGYIGRHDGMELGTAYRFQRLLEHRVQLYRLRRTHLLPSDHDGLRRLARSVGLRGGDDEVTAQFRQSAQKVLRLHRRIFYSPLVEAATRISSQEMALSPQAARDRLRVLGFSDPDAALRHIQALTSGLSRGAEIQHQLMPAMLGWLAEAPSPDAGLLAFRQVSESLSSSPWYLRTLRDSGTTAHRLATILSSSRYVVDLLKRDPEAVQLMTDDADLVPRDLEPLVTSMRSVMQRHADIDDAVRAIRAQRRRELFRISVADLLGLVDLATVGRALSALTTATVHVTLEAVARDVDRPPWVGVLALGRWGGREQSYGSDADAIFVHADSDDPEAGSKATAMVAKLRQLLGAPGSDPALAIDADLRPEGKSGPMVRSVSSTIAYYGRWADTWEAQALLRAEFGGGHRDSVERVLAEVSGLRWPEGGLTRAQVSDIRKLKARMESERLPRGQDPRRHLKLGPGGLSDVEWTVQLHQLLHAHDHADLRTTSTLQALERLADDRLIDPLDAEKLAHSWELASRLRNAIVLTKGRASDAIPTDARDLAAMSHLLGRGFGQASELLEEWSRAARRSARVTDRLFWSRS